VKYRCTGHAFVTFNHAEDAQAAARTLGRPNFSAIFGGGLRVSRAPEPHDVIWENLDCGPREQLARIMASNLVLLALTALGAAILTFTSVLSQVDVFTSKNLFAGGFFDGIAVWLMQLVAIIGGHLVIFIAVPVLANVLERHHTHGAKEMRIMLTLSFFQCFNNVLTVTVMLWVSTQYNPNADGRFISGWYVSGAALIINGLIGDLFVICIFVDGIRPQDVIRRRILAPAAKTQARMNDLATIPADIYLAFRVQLMNKFIVLGLMYGFAIPILYIIVALYMWVSQWVDRINLLRRLTPPPATHDKQMAFVYKVVLPAAIVLHVVMAVKLFYDICDGHGYTAGTDYVSLTARELQQCSSSLTAGTICTEPDPLGETLRGQAAQVLNGTLDDVPIALTCIYSNNSGVFRTLCHVQSRGLSAVCGDQSWTSAKVIINASAVLWILVIVFATFICTGKPRASAACANSDGSERKRKRSDGSWMQQLCARLTPRNVFRLLLQRDVLSKTIGVRELPPGAHVRAPRAFRHLSEWGGSDKQPADREPPRPSVQQRSSMMSPQRENRLADDAPFYVPPLTRVLLISIAHDAVNRSLLLYLRGRQRRFEALLHPTPDGTVPASGGFLGDVGGWTRRKLSMGVSSGKIDTRPNVENIVTACNLSANSTGAGPTRCFGRVVHEPPNNPKQLISHMLMLESQLSSLSSRASGRASAIQDVADVALDEAGVDAEPIDDGLEAVAEDNESADEDMQMLAEAAERLSRVAQAATQASSRASRIRRARGVRGSTPDKSREASPSAQRPSREPSFPHASTPATTDAGGGDGMGRRDSLQSAQI